MAMRKTLRAFFLLNRCIMKQIELVLHRQCLLLLLTGIETSCWEKTELNRRLF